MRSDSRAEKSRNPRPLKKPRKHGRLPQELLHCNLGEIIDISAGGMCVVCDRLLPTLVQVKFYGFTLPEPLIAQPMWNKRRENSKWEVGLRFVEVTPIVAEALTIIAGAHRVRDVG